LLIFEVEDVVLLLYWSHTKYCWVCHIMICFVCFFFCLAFHELTTTYLLVLCHHWAEHMKRLLYLDYLRLYHENTISGKTV
jgi:hypothetical protein